MRAPFIPVQPFGEIGTYAVPKRVSRGEHRGWTAAAGKDAICLERDGPRLAAIADFCQREMPLTAKDRLGFGKRLSACLREAGKAIFANADDGQPRIKREITHDTRPHPGWNK